MRRVKNNLVLVSGILLLALLLSYMFFYEVPYNKVAVVTTFGRADADSVRWGRDAGTGLLGNLHMKAPRPIQDVKIYDARVQLIHDSVDDQAEQLSTADNKTVILRTSLAWKISDPLKFMRTMVSEENARQRLRVNIRNARSLVGAYSMDQLTNTDAAMLKLAEIEEKATRRIQKDLDDQEAGIQVASFSITRVVLPRSVSEEVFNRMRAYRERLAQNARSTGDSEATEITSRAKLTADRVLAFAKLRADAIKAEGERAAAEIYARYRQDEDFAIFLRKLEAYKTTLGNNTYFIIDGNKGLFDMFSNPPALPSAAAPAGIQLTKPIAPPDEIKK